MWPQQKPLLCSRNKNHFFSTNALPIFFTVIVLRQDLFASLQPTPTQTLVRCGP